jgi:hypothetical protein
MLRRETSYSGMLGEWKRLLGGMDQHAADLAHLSVSRDKLASKLTALEQLFQEQASRQAGKQESSQQVKSLLSESQRLVTLLRQGVKEHFGPGAETLVEFGLTPFRGRRRRVTPAPSPELMRLVEPPGSPVTDLKAERVEES